MLKVWGDRGQPYKMYPWNQVQPSRRLLRQPEEKKLEAGRKHSALLLLKTPGSFAGDVA